MCLKIFFFLLESQILLFFLFCRASRAVIHAHRERNVKPEKRSWEALWGGRRGKEVEIKSIFLFSRRVTSSSSSFVDDFEKVQVSNFFRVAIILHFLLRCNRLNWTRLLLLLVEWDTRAYNCNLMSFREVDNTKKKFFHDRTQCEAGNSHRR